MNDLFPFLYQYRLNELIYLPEKTIVQAGPGMGKSTFIEKLQDAFKKEQKESTYIKCSINKKEDGIKKILGWFQSDDNKILLVDNLDHVYDDALEDEFRNLNSIDERIVIATSCTPTRVHFLGNEHVGLNESLDNKSTTLNSTMTGSLGLSSFASMWLSPWDGQWEERITVIIQSVLNCHSKDIEVKLKKKETTQFLNKEIASISLRILQTSGGHPILLHRIMNTFIRQILSKTAILNTDNNEESIDEVFQELIPTIIENCSPRIYAELEWAESLLPFRVYQRTLNEIIQNKEPHNANGVRVLRQAGIVNKTRNKTGFVCSIIQEVTKNRLLTIEERGQTNKPSEKFQNEKKPKVTLEPRLPDNLLGSIIYQVPGQTDKIIELSPAEWKIIVYLKKNEGKLVTVDTLLEKLSPDSQASIRSALQRLTNKLAKANIQNLVTNIPRKGYLYNSLGISQ